MQLNCEIQAGYNSPTLRESISNTASAKDLKTSNQVLTENTAKFFNEKGITKDMTAVFNPTYSMNNPSKEEKGNAFLNVLDRCKEKAGGGNWLTSHVKQVISVEAGKDGKINVEMLVTHKDVEKNPDGTLKASDNVKTSKVSFTYSDQTNSLLNVQAKDASTPQLAQN
jgi:hypothetical protein